MVCLFLTEEGEIDWENWLPDGRYPHAAQVHERLSFLRFLLKDGQLWLCAEQVLAYFINREIEMRYLFMAIKLFFFSVGETDLDMPSRKTSTPRGPGSVLSLV